MSKRLGWVLLLGSAISMPTADCSELVSYWPLDGHLRDTARGGQTQDDGSFVGGSVYGEGYRGEGIVLDGSNYVEIPTSGDVEARETNITICAWFRVDGWRGRYETLLAKGQGAHYRLARNCIDPQRLAWFGGHRTDPMAAPSGGAVNDGGWHHVIGVSAARQETLLWIDGELVKTGTAENAWIEDRSHALFLGSNPQPGGDSQNWVGAIDEVGVFAGVLNVAESRAVYALSQSNSWAYELTTIEKILRLHQERQRETLRVGETTWKYARHDPQDGHPFLVLAESGSGVTASPAPQVVSFTSSRYFLKSGESAELFWQVTEDAESISLTSVGTEGLAVAGRLEVSPPESTEYQLAIRSQGGEGRAVLRIEVDYDFAVPRLSEMMAASKGEYLDEDGVASDWIELHNPSRRMASTRNLFLTDDPENLTMWPLPERLVSGGESWVIFASGKDRGGEKTPWHTNFKLAAGGEYLALVKSTRSGVEVISSWGARYPKQKSGVAFGIDIEGRVGRLARPTPQQVNAEVVMGKVKSVRFGATRGWYDAPFDLSLDCDTEEAVLYYTTDGSIPGPEQGRAYQGPIFLGATAVVRAVAYKAGMRPSTVITHSYFFLDSVIRQSHAPRGFPQDWDALPADYEMDPRVTEDPEYAADLRRGLKELPTISLVLPTSDLFGREGIYTNPMDTGNRWERAASLEILQPSGEADYQIDCGLRVHGGFGRNRTFPKHSLRVLFKGRYGAKKLKYRVFPEADATTEFDALVLRGGFNNSWQTGSDRSQHLRDEFVRRSQRAMGQPASHGMFAHLYLNGLYWGLYNVVERPSAAFAAAYLGGRREDYDALNSGRPVDGTADSWRQLHDRARKSTPQDVLDRLSDSIDLDNLIDYMLLNFYIGNDDWAGHNWYAAGRREPGSPYYFFCWDGEKSLGNALVDNNLDTNREHNPSFLFHQLLRNANFRSRVQARVQTHFFDNGALTTGKAAARYTRLAKWVENAMVAESARWGDAQGQTRPLTRDEHWVRERDRLLQEWFPRRTEVLLEQLSAEGKMGYLSPPQLVREGDFVVLATDLGNLYWTTDGSDPRAADGRPSARAQVLERATQKTPLVVRGSDWKYLDDGSDQGRSWRLPEFDDANWKRGPARLGYGGDGEDTRISAGGDPGNKHITSYFRTTFNLSGAVEFDFVTLFLSRDDGAVVYLNGREVVRSNFSGEGEITFRTAARNAEDELAYLAYKVGREFFQPGNNVVAVEVHQSSPASSDLGFDLSLEAVREQRMKVRVPTLGTLHVRRYLEGTWSALTVYKTSKNE